MNGKVDAGQKKISGFTPGLASVLLLTSLAIIGLKLRRKNRKDIISVYQQTGPHTGMFNYYLRLLKQSIGLAKKYLFLGR
ncbi:hypothetical protein [Mucilaginibacter celer]|uniref:Uncharacterized protein n=1 Tax=Mucilaginibacter celer TaxID=2305508 RepID=A0A494VX92_9SPHI|nr:hypothetical protein [Mucilaginibacter celer]AYL95938.1 hypothetical protein HYN43_011850 [Mucilaginibacter celer]